MPKYRVACNSSNNSFIVQCKSLHWPFWTKAFWQEFETFEDARDLQSVFEKPIEALSSSKARTRLAIYREIRRLSVIKAFLTRSRTSSTSDLKRLHKIEVRLGRVYRIYEKLLTQLPCKRE
jgi:hypothetical protein